MIPTTPYLIRAIYEWCEDQGFTPHLLVDTSVEDVVVPWHLVENDTIVLNIQASAVRSLEMGNEWIVFNARFSGQAMDVTVPVAAVRAIFARENGQGYAFEAPVELTPEQSANAMQELNAQIQADQENSETKDKGNTRPRGVQKSGSAGKKGSNNKKDNKQTFLKLVE